MSKAPLKADQADKQFARHDPDQSQFDEQGRCDRRHDQVWISRTVRLAQHGAHRHLGIFPVHGVRDEIEQALKAHEDNQDNL
jgi:hypothetical protein